ncbi:MAG: substrate-binding domain-containing protein, partial [Bacteroidales bacterium]|nr:substrate-binding domain-containing protein [Bacteroidales bacterium]
GDVLAGVRKALSEFSSFGVTNCVRVMERYDEVEQSEVIDEMVNAGVKGIVLTPVNNESIRMKINLLSKQGIKFVTINTDIAGTERIAYVGSHHTKSGFVMAGLLGVIAKGSILNLAVIKGEESNLAVARRYKGMINTLSKDFSNIRIVSEIENEGRDDCSYDQVTKLLRHQEDFDAICVLGAGIAGAIQAYRAANLRHHIYFFVYDLIAEVRQALLDGVVDATITQEPFKQGYDGVQLLTRYLAYGQVPNMQLNYTNLSIVTKYCL